MSPEDMKRRGSWAVRFCGRDPLPPLVDAKGRPTRFALSAHAWGEKVPTTEAQARKIAVAGRRLLERYQASKTGGPPAKKTAVKNATRAVEHAPTRKAVAKKSAVASKSPTKKTSASTSRS